MRNHTANALARIEILGRISDHPDHLVRTFLSPANILAARKLCEWMEDLGMETCHSQDGTVRGILPGSAPEAQPLIIGSHIDTVINAGKYDGALGLVGGLAALEDLAAQDIALPFPVHLVAFSDEEGTRFQTTYLGSRCIVESLDEPTLAQKDSTGISIAQALKIECWQENCQPIFYKKSAARAYIELHIEQGRVLEEAGESVCVVSGISGQSRLSITIKGRADHAGTTPMDLRADALTGAAECILEIEKLARAHTDLVATVGKLEVLPGASNSIPETTHFTIDLRHPIDSARLQHLSDLEATCARICKTRGLALHWQLVQENNAVPCDPGLTRALLASTKTLTGKSRLLASGAGHDGVAVSAAMPIAMLFVRSRDGLSHHPDEFSSPEDIETAIDVLVDFLRNLPA